MVQPLDDLLEAANPRLFPLGTEIVTGLGSLDGRRHVDIV